MISFLLKCSTIVNGTMHAPSQSNGLRYLPMIPLCPGPTLIELKIVFLLSPWFSHRPMKHFVFLEMNEVTIPQLSVSKSGLCTYACRNGLFCWSIQQRIGHHAV